MERQVLQRCEMGDAVHPLYLTVLMSSLLSNLRWTDEEVVECLNCPNTEQLYHYLIQDILGRHSRTAPHVRKALQLILVSQNGVPESALFDLVPELTWNTWAPVCQELQDRYILTVKCGLLNYAYKQARIAVQLLFSPDEELVLSRDELTEYYMKAVRSNNATCHICDELPGLLQSSENLPLLREFASNVDVFRILYTRGRYADILNCWQTVGLDRLSVSKEYFEIIKQMEEAAALNDTPCPEVANLFEMVGKFSKDLGLLNQRALEVREAIDPDDPNVGRCFYLLGSLHIQWGKVASAESYFKQALYIWEMCEASCQQWVTKALDSLAILYKRQGKYDMVESLTKKSATLKKEVASQEASSQSQRGQGNLKRRIQVLQEQCQKLEGVPLAEALADLGVLFLWQQDLESAKEHLTQGITIIERLCSVRTPKLLRPLGTLATVYETAKDLEQAEGVYLRMLDICKKIPERDSPIANMAARNLGSLYKKQGKFEKAEMLYKDSIRRKEACLGTEHPNVATDLLNLAILFCQQGNHAQALPLFERALSVYENCYGPRHPRVAEILRNLAVLHYERGNEQRAAELYKRANEMKEMMSISGGSRLASRRSSVTSVSVSRPLSEK
ncbi:putative nephrocystin-3 [Apostichopus japonicus]|uniref:Nephrocystin-3 n=1 Tax=Stichopus japonicus TaxID=307972 RepID=A0A2G8JXR5_STIJA|nr:putative nephrocystin-3 [Apostichopus japonicus]